MTRSTPAIEPLGGSRQNLSRGAWASALGVCLGLCLAAPANAAGFRPAPDTDLTQLEQLLVETSPDLEDARLQVDLAGAAVRQSRLIPNPQLDLSYATIPIGQTNPPGLERPFANVPNYGIGISFPIEIAKRGPRVREARALERGVRMEFEAVTRARALDLAQTLGELATASLRVEGFEQVVVEMERTVEVAAQRVNLTYGAPLEVDKLRIELARARSLVAVARSDVAQALANCAMQTGGSCESFVDGETARAYLEAWIDGEAVVGELEHRRDLVALSEYADAARAAQKLARAQAIPDPTLRFGYLHDRFLESGNHRNSLALSLSFDLPVFDRGQAQRDAAVARERRLVAERSKRLEAANAQIPALAERVEIERERRRALRDEAIPIAKQVVESVEQAADQRLIPIGENVQARRVLRELLLEEADAYAAAYAAQLALLRAQPPKR